MQHDGGRSIKPTRQGDAAWRHPPTTARSRGPRSPPSLINVLGEAQVRCEEGRGTARHRSVILRRPSLSTSLKCTLGYNATNKLRLVAWGRMSAVLKSTQEPQSCSIEAAIFRRKWQAGIVPGRTLPPHEDIVLGSLGRLADRLIVVEGQSPQTLKVLCCGRGIHDWLVPMLSTSRSGDCPRNLPDRCARGSSVHSRAESPNASMPAAYVPGWWRRSSCWCCRSGAGGDRRCWRCILPRSGPRSISWIRSFDRPRKASWRLRRIKINRSFFVRDLAERTDCIAIIRTVAGLGASLGISTTAAGVETLHRSARPSVQPVASIGGHHVASCDGEGIMSHLAMEKD